MKTMIRFLVLSALALAAALAVLSFGLPTNELSISFPDLGEGQHVSDDHVRPVPPAITATPGDGQVTISWQTVEDAAGYEIWMRQEDTEWLQLAEGLLDTATTSYTHNGLAAGETYIFTGRTVGDSGLKSTWSPQAEVTLPASALPAPVLEATAGMSLVTITWQPVEGAGTYQLWLLEDDKPFHQLDDGSLTDTSFIHTGFAAAGTYAYTGRAVTADGKVGAWASHVSADLTQILPVTTLTAAPEADRVELSWQPVTGAETYEVRVWDTVDAWDRLDDRALTDTSLSHTELTIGKSYHYWVRARTSAGAKSPWSERTSAVAMPAPILTATPGAEQTELTWEPVTGTAAYELHAWDTVDGWERLDGGALTDTSFSHSGLTTGRTYLYWVRSLTDEGAHGPWSVRVDTAALAAPVLTATPGQQQVTLNWQQVTGAATYELEVWDSDGGHNHLDDGALTQNAFVHSALTAGKTYRYMARGINADGMPGPWSEPVEASP